MNSEAPQNDHKPLEYKPKFDTRELRLCPDLTSSFRKEGILEHPGFKIFTDQDNHLILCKAPIPGSADADFLTPYTQLSEVDRTFRDEYVASEVAAGKIAQILHAPVPDTQRVIHDGVLYSASEYYPNAKDYSLSARNMPLSAVPETQLHQQTSLAQAALLKFVLDCDEYHDNGQFLQAEDGTVLLVDMGINSLTQPIKPDQNVSLLKYLSSDAQIRKNQYAGMQTPEFQQSLETATTLKQKDLTTLLKSEDINPTIIRAIASRAEAAKRIFEDHLDLMNQL